MDHGEQKPKRLTFDPTINAGHILTFMAMAVSLFVGWSALDKRVVVLEQTAAYQARRDDQQDVQTGERLREIKDAIREIKDGVNEIRREQSQRNKP